MALDFPLTPVDGQTYNDGVTIWTYSSITGGWSRPPSTIGNDPWLHAEPTVGSLAVGLSAGEVSGLVGEYNTVAGRFGNGISLVAGARNSFYGAGAGKSLTDPSDNTLIGYNAGASLQNINVSSNVVIGANAQSAYSKAQGVVVIGTWARTLATDENDSIVIGNGALGKGTGTAVLGSAGTINDSYLFGVTHLNAALQTAVFTVATLPTLKLAEGQIIYVSDAAAGGVHCTYNGTNWVLIGTQTTVT